MLEALSSGASAYVLKDSSSGDLVHAVREAAAGRRYLSPPLSDRAIEVYQQRAKATTLDRYETLTAREKEVLHLAAEGHTSAEIASRLGISGRTAETHRSNLMHKLDLHTQAELIRFALQARHRFHRRLITNRQDAKIAKRSSPQITQITQI